MQLHRAQPQFAAAGAEVRLIGMGTQRQAAWFRAKFAPSLPVLSDEERLSYRAAGLKVGSVVDLVGPRSVVGGVRHALRSGVVQGRPVGDVAQLGGALVVAAGGRVLLQQRARDASDSADVASLLEAVA